jgi:PhnB protein
MANQTQSEQLDKIVERLLGRPGAPLAREDAERPLDMKVASVIELIRDLRSLPRPDFKARLKAELERRATMASSAKAVPRVRTAVTPYLSIKGAAAAIEFYKKAFGAKEVLRLMQPDGRIGHAEMDIDGAKIMFADEFPEIGFRSPESLGGSPLLIHLDVADVDALARRAVSAGATVVRPVADQFYGERSGHFRDPFGYTWVISTRTEEMSAGEMQRRSEEFSRRQSAGSAETAETKEAPGGTKFIREGFHTVTPYLIIPDAARWIDFVKQAFAAEEKFRMGRPGAEDLIMHAEVKIGDSMIEVADANPQYPATPSTLLLRVSDPDAAFARAIAAGATLLEPVSDKDHGSRGGTVVDVAGNRLHISAPTPGNKIFEDFRSVTPHFNPLRSAEFIEFLEEAFGGEEIYRAQSPEGRILHAQVRIGDSIISMGDAHGPYQPMPSTMHLYVPDTDALYTKALRAGAVSIQPPADQPYGDRSAGVRDAHGNRWFIATHIKDVAF